MLLKLDVFGQFWMYPGAPLHRPLPSFGNSWPLGHDFRLDLGCWVMRHEPMYFWTSTGVSGWGPISSNTTSYVILMTQSFTHTPHSTKKRIQEYCIWEQIPSRKTKQTIWKEKKASLCLHAERKMQSYARTQTSLRSPSAILTETTSSWSTPLIQGCARNEKITAFRGRQTGVYIWRTI